jgi:hypothetical protein
MRHAEQAIPAIYTTLRNGTVELVERIDEVVQCREVFVAERIRDADGFEQPPGAVRPPGFISFGKQREREWRDRVVDSPFQGLQEASPLRKYLARLPLSRRRQSRTDVLLGGWQAI